MWDWIGGLNGGLIWGLVIGLTIAGTGGWLLYRRLCAAQARARYVERLAELGTLTGGLAHEIKNPLSTVQLNLQLLQEDLVGDRNTSPRVISRLATIQREASRLRETLDDFLRYAGRLELQREPVDLNNMLGELVDFLAPQAQIARIQLRQMPCESPVVASVDPKLIKQSALNLMLNAMQAMPGGGELIVGAQRRDGHVLLSFTDTGPGISADDQAKIFEAYFSKRKGGMGLGLAMTKRITQEHGGHVELDSQLGKGSRFTLVLPVNA
ncbi:MAG: two-component sensor histidine kinase [Burkholderiales bacterium]|nr:two-component sensor histidine kinase [Phycisphaerae bacterium]